MSGKNERGRSVSGQRDRERWGRGGEGKRGNMESVSGEKEEGEIVN